MGQELCFINTYILHNIGIKEQTVSTADEWREGDMGGQIVAQMVERIYEESFSFHNQHTPLEAL